MKRLILHIGTHKTATTSIQDFLRSNADEIAKQGIAVPYFPGQFYIKNPNRNAQFLIRRAMMSLSSTFTDEDNAPLVEEHSELFKEALSKHDTILLSDELLWRKTATTPGFAAELKRELREYGIDEVEFVVYLRRQDTLLTSLYRQSIKDGISQTDSWEEFAKKKRYRKMLDYDRVLNILEDTFENSKITVRIFEPCHFEGGDIYHDFCAACGIEFTDELVIPEMSKNPTTGPNLTEIKRLTNELPTTDYTNRDYFKLASARVASLGNDPTSCSYMTPEEQLALMERYAEGNAEIARKYFGRDDGVLFNTDNLPLPQCESDSMQFSRNAVQFLSMALLHEQRYTGRLKERITEQGKRIVQQEEQVRDLEKRMKRIESVNRNSLMLKVERKVRGRETLEGKYKKKPKDEGKTE